MVKDSGLKGIGELENYCGVGFRKVTDFGLKRHRRTVRTFRNSLSVEIAAGVTTNKLNGAKIVVSGVFTRFSRNELKKLIEDNGGKNVSSISKSTDFIVAGDSMGPAKKEKAEKLGVRTITEDEFVGMLE